MQLRVLGCSGSIAAGCRTTSFLLGRHVLIDAGTGVGDLGLEDMAEIDHVLLSHAHLDHVLGLPLLADSVKRLRGGRPIAVHALAPTLQALRDHVFNGVIWPDFTRLPAPEQPMLTLHEVQVGQMLELSGHRLEVLPAVHTVPACGFAIHTPTSVWAYTGDTGPNPALWQRLAELPLAGLIIETAFRDEERVLARLSRHLHPSALVEELASVPTETLVHLTHVKPGEEAFVCTEIEALKPRQRILPLAAGHVLSLG